MWINVFWFLNQFLLILFEEHTFIFLKLFATYVTVLYYSCNIDWWIMVGLGSSNKKVCDNKIPPNPLLSRFESQGNIVVTVHVQSGTVVHTLDFIIVYLHHSHYIYIWGGSCKGGYPSRQDINQGVKKVIFKACHSGKLKLEYNSPNVINFQLAPKTFWWAEWISQFFFNLLQCNFNASV